MLALSPLDATLGCGGREAVDFTSVAEPPTVRLVGAEPRTIERVVGQPSFVESYEHSSIFPKMTAYVDGSQWIEVTRHRPAGGRNGSWKPFDGSEQVIVGDLSLLSEGERVRVAAETAENRTMPTLKRTMQGKGG